MKTKNVKRTPQEWIQLAQECGGFRPSPPSKLFLVEQRRTGKPQQMEFSFDQPQEVPTVRKAKKRHGNEIGENGGGAA